MQVERYNHTTVARLRNYVVEHHDNWKSFLQLLIYANSTQTHRSTGLSFILVLSRQRAGATTFHFPSVILSDLSRNVSPRILRSRLLPRVTHMRKKGDKQLPATKNRYKNDYTERVRETLLFKTGELVFVSRPPLEVNTNSSKANDKPKYKKLIPGAKIWSKTQYERATAFSNNRRERRLSYNIDPSGMPAPPDNTNADTSKERTDIKGEEGIIVNEHQAPDGELQRAKGVTQTIDAHSQRPRPTKRSTRASHENAASQATMRKTPSRQSWSNPKCSG